MKRSFSVGLLTLVTIAALIYMINRTQRAFVGSGQLKSYYSLVNDSTGLPKGAAVRIAGIDIGRLKEKSLSEGKAKLVFAVNPEITVYKNAKIRLKSIGYLGDLYMDLWPGSTDTLQLEENSLIAAEEAATIESITREGSDLLQIWKDVGKSLSALFGRP